MEFSLLRLPGCQNNLDSPLKADSNLFRIYFFAGAAHNCLYFCREFTEKGIIERFQKGKCINNTCELYSSMTVNEQQKIGKRGLTIQMQIPIFYKLMVSMLFVAMLPVLLLGIVSMGETKALITTLGLQTVIFIITCVTLTIIMMWSFFLSTHITKPIVQLSEIATSISKGEVKTTEIQFMSNDEIGDLITAFNKMINTYKILDTLSREET